MLKNSRARNTLGAGILIFATLAGAFAVFSPAGAQSALNQLTSLSCFDNKECLKITNTAPSGKAIVGIAQNASALLGRININTNKNPQFPLADFFINGGVRGEDVSTNPLDNNAGVLGVSKNGQGVAGLTTAEHSPYGSIGVLGADLSTTANGNGGVVGVSNHNVGVVGTSFDTKTGIGVNGQVDGGLGVFGLSNSSTKAGQAVVGFTLLGNGGYFASGDPKLAAILLNNFGGGPIIDAFGGKSGNTDVMQLDNAGNLTIAGNLETGETPMAVNSTSAGRKVLTYASQQSVRTVEDVGEAQLVGGQAIVRLEPTFASAIDPRTPYLVFITPQGKTSGLYVTQKTPSGFAVREYNGTSSVAFDYRIVAKPYGSTAQRMPLYAALQAGAALATESILMQRVSRRLHR